MSDGAEAGDPRDAERAFLERFRREAEARLDRIVSALASVKEGGATRETAEKVFLDVHTIRGAAAMLALDDVRTLAHAMGSALERAGGAIPPELADRLLRGAEALRLEVVGEGGRSGQVLDELDRAAPRRRSRSRGDCVSPRTVLVIDDSETVRATLQERLERGGYRVETAEDGPAGLRALYTATPDVVLLDVVMPGLDGWRTLDRIREVSDVPVIMLTSRDSDVERVRGLRGGADDYVGKPFSPSELTARIEALLRRAGGRAPPRERYDDGTVAIDFATREVTVRRQPVSLTPLEFRLLAQLTEHAGQVLSRQQLFELVWGGEREVSGDPVKIYVGYLRRKVEEDAARPRLIETVRGFGYRYRPPDAVTPASAART